jgi:arylsulfatase A-like enzyme
MTSVLLVVFDGLRPDAIRAEVTPNLVRFAAMAARMPKARSVFPSETRVCTSSVSTGCHPRRHGLVANRMIHPGDRARIVETGRALALREMEQEIGAPALLVPTLSDLLAGAGRDFAVFSSGTSGQTFLLAPLAEAHGQTVVSVHGPQFCTAAGRRLLEQLSPPPAQPAERAVWIADAWRTTMLPDPPAASVLWLCEPDTSAHYDGLDSAEQRRKLADADAAFGRILDDWQAGPHAESLQIIVASDHGHVTGDGLVDIQAALRTQALFEGCTLTGGPSGGIAVPDGARERIVGLAGWLMRQDWIGHVLTAEVIDPLPGTLPQAAALIDNRRTAHVLYTLRNSNEVAPNGLIGTSLLDVKGGLGVGGGTHGGLNRFELSTVLMLGGAALKRGFSSDWPAGLVDIAPTILALLGLPGGEAMDGRVLTEVLAEGEAPSESHSSDSWEAADAQYAQRVQRMRLGRHLWIDHGAGATISKR